MIITAKVITKASREEIVESIGTPYKYKIYVKSPPDKGKANAEVIKLVSLKFNTNKSSVLIVSGRTSNLKTIEICNSI